MRPPIYVALLVVVGFLFPCTLGLYPIVSQEVAFVSNAPSGDLTLQGTLTLPQGAPGPVPGIVLISGSGAGQRNETIVYPSFNFVISPPKAPSCGQISVDVSVFVDIAEYFSARGFAVLRYDKRTCVKGSGVPGCEYPLCPLNETNPPSNCLNLHKFTSWDLVTDGSSAVQFLATVNGVNGKNITVMGHSEGCLIAPHVGSNNSALVRQVVLLAGTGVVFTDLVVDQLANQVLIAETLLYSCIVAGVPHDVVERLVQNLNLTIALLEETVLTNTLVLNGTYPSTELIFWVRSVVPVGYITSIEEMGQFNTMHSVMKTFAQGGGKVLAVNSPTDSQVFPKIYQPLHAVLLGLPTPQTVAIVYDLTHVLTPADFSSGTVAETLLETVLN